MAVTTRGFLFLASQTNQCYCLYLPVFFLFNFCSTQMCLTLVEGYLLGVQMHQWNYTHHLARRSWESCTKCCTRVIRTRFGSTIFLLLASTNINHPYLQIIHQPYSSDQLRCTHHFKLQPTRQDVRASFTIWNSRKPDIVLSVSKYHMIQ